jgi:nicotinamidase-related amidase
LYITARETTPGPIRWSEATVQALRAAGKDVTFVKYRCEGHTFERQWQRSIERIVAYFDKHLDSVENCRWLSTKGGRERHA